jgi:hypothetical protein
MVTEGFMHIDITEKLKRYIHLSAPRKPVPAPPKSEKYAIPVLSEQAVVNDSKKTIKPKPKNNDKISKVKAVSIDPPSNKAIPIAAPTNNRPTNGHTNTARNKQFNHTAQPQSSAKLTKEKSITIEIELVDHDEYNISHISISAVTRKPTHEVRVR